MWNSSPLETLDKTKIISHQVCWRLNWKTCICCCTLDIYWFNIIEQKSKSRDHLWEGEEEGFFSRTFPLNLSCCQYSLQCQIPSLNRSKESHYIFGDCNKFHFMPNLPVSYSCLLTMLVGILCDVSPICQSLRSAPSRERDSGERDSMDSTGNGGSRSKVLRNLHIVRHLLKYVKEIVWLHCKSNLSIKGRSQ